MKVLMINKFLYPNGGSETYMFELGKQLERMGHEVQYFGMEHEGRCVGNRVDAYTGSMDFHGGSKLAKLTYPLKTIYSSEARQKLRLVLDDFRPDVIHLNNFNYQLTPSILLEADKWRKESGHACRILYTAHDHQLVCPDHLCYQSIEGHSCEECLGGHYVNCIKHRCIHGSRARSVIGCAEAMFWKWKKVYRKLDVIICCSAFLKKKLDTNPDLREGRWRCTTLFPQRKPRLWKNRTMCSTLAVFPRKRALEPLWKPARLCRTSPLWRRAAARWKGRWPGSRT